MLEVGSPALVVAVPALVLVEDLPPQVANWGDLYHWGLENQGGPKNEGLAVLVLAHQLEVQVEGLSEPDWAECAEEAKWGFPKEPLGQTVENLLPY